MPSESETVAAYEDDECLFCAPAPHENCERYTVLQLLDPADVPLTEESVNHLVDVPVCLAHYEAFEKYQRANSVGEVTA